MKLHYPKMQIKYDEWIEIDSPRIAPLYSKVQRPLKKETTDTISKLRGLKVDKPLNYKEQKKDVNELSRQKHATGQRRKTDEDTQPSGETQPVFADDSSMADVFLQDSDDDSDLLQDADDDRDSSILRNKPRPVAPRRSILHESDDNTDPDAEKEEYDELVDSDVEELKKGVSLSKCQSIPLTDDGDAGKARKKPETSNGKTSSWTIPKKRSAPVASSLIALAPVQEDDKLPPGSPLHVTKANRIPRKKLPASSAETLLFAEPKLNVAQLGQEERQRNVSSKIRMSASDSRPIGSAKPNGKGEYSTGQALARDDGARNAANSRNDASWSIGKAGDRVQLAEPHVVDGEIERLKASDVNSRNHVHSSDSSRLHSNLYSPNNSREPRVLNRTERRSGDHHDPSRYDDSLFRDREHRLESTNDSYSRQYDYTRERDNPRRFDENRLGFPSDERHRHDEGYGPARHDVNTRYHQESRGYHSSRHMSNHGRDRYNESNYTYAEGYDDRWRESHYGTSTKHFRDEGMRQRDRTSRDRERVSSRRYEQSPVEKGYDRHVDRHYREHDDHDEYWYRRHGHDRYEGHENPRYDESPRPKYRSRKSRDRSRDSGKQHFEPASEGYRQNSKERHGHQIQYNSANFDEQEFLGGNRTSRGDSEKKMPREEEPARQKGHSYMRESWRDTSQAR